ncbi:MAG: ArsA family ATPase, partial [Actinobacteria bacterium]|nr:ArsA family ATPase [Actinomycetota bacterium]
KESQARYMQMVEERFAPIPIRYIPLMTREIVGLQALEEVADKLFAGEDPTAVYSRGRGYTFGKDEQGYELSIPLPLATKSDVTLKQVGDELIVHVGNQKRNLVLPRALVGQQTRGARMEEGVLKIRFGGG